MLWIWHSQAGTIDHDYKLNLLLRMKVNQGIGREYSFAAHA